MGGATVAGAIPSSSVHLRSGTAVRDSPYPLICIKG